MNENKKFTNLQTFLKDGELYFKYTVVTNGVSRECERPYYGKDGKVDPEVSIIMQKAKEQDAINEASNITTTESTNANTESSKSIEPVRNLTVYSEPPKKTSLLKSKRTWIIVALSAALILSRLEGCEKKEISDETTEKVDDYSTEGQLLSEQEQAKIQYISKTDFYQGVTDLQKHLNEKLGYNYPLDNLYSFYYIANFDNVSDEMFQELVEEGFMPDTTMAILEKALNVTSAVADLNMKSGVSTINYDYIFVDEEANKQAKIWQQKYNTAVKADVAGTQIIVDEARDYWMISSTNSAKFLPLGAKEMLSFMEVTNIFADASAKKGIEISQATWDSIYDFSSLMSSIEDKFVNASVIAAEQQCKQLTK